MQPVRRFDETVHTTIAAADLFAAKMAYETDPSDLAADRTSVEVPDEDRAIVVYCWGPGYEGSTRAALALSTLGCRRVRELIGGFDYWSPQGLTVVS